MNFTTKLLNALAILTFQFGYMEWGQDNSSFIFEAEAEILAKAGEGIGNVIHPLIIIPLVGSVMLLITLFQKSPGKRLTLVGISCLGILMAILLIIGILGANVRMLLSVVPFWLVVIGILRWGRWYKLKSK